MENTIVFVSGFSGYENGMTSVMNQLRTIQHHNLFDARAYKVIDYSTHEELYSNVLDAWRNNCIPVVETDIESIKHISDPFPNSSITRVLFAPSSYNAYYNELLSKTDYSDQDIDKIIGKAEVECDRVWLFDRIIIDSNTDIDAFDFFSDKDDAISAKRFDLLDFKENLSSILYKRRYDRLMNNKINVVQTNTEPG